MVAGRDVAVTTRVWLARFSPALSPVIGIARGAKSLVVRWVPSRFHAITDELAKFGTIGLINLGVNFGVFNLLLIFAFMQGSQVKAKAIATVVAVTCAYFLNRHWTYRHRPKTTLRREYSLFFFFNAVGLVIEVGFVALAKYGLHETNVLILNLFVFAGIAVGTVFRFWAYRTHVFKPEGDELDPALEPLADAEEPSSAVAPVSPALPVRIRLPQTIVVSHSGPATDGRLADDDRLHAELVQLELDQVVDEEVDRATR